MNERVPLGLSLTALGLSLFALLSGGGPDITPLEERLERTERALDAAQQQLADLRQDTNDLKHRRGGGGPGAGRGKNGPEGGGRGPVGSRPGASVRGGGTWADRNENWVRSVQDQVSEFLAVEDLDPDVESGIRESVDELVQFSAEIREDVEAEDMTALEAREEILEIRSETMEQLELLLPEDVFVRLERRLHVPGGRRPGGGPAFGRPALGGPGAAGPNDPL